MTPSPGTISRGADAISALRAITPASGSGILIRGSLPGLSRPLVVLAPITKKPRSKARFPGQRGDASALASLVSRIRLVDDVDATLPPHDAAVLVALLP